MAGQENVWMKNRFAARGHKRNIKFKAAGANKTQEGKTVEQMELTHWIKSICSQISASMLTSHNTNNRAVNQFQILLYARASHQLFTASFLLRPGLRICGQLMQFLTRVIHHSLDC